jgi:hypothetical protein
MQLFHRYFTFLVGVRTQKAFIFCQQQYVAVFGRLNLDNLNVLGIFFLIIVDGLKALMPFIEQIEFTVALKNGPPPNLLPMVCFHSKTHKQY